MLDERDAVLFWQVFEDTPLFAKWPRARDELPSRLNVISANQGEAIFWPGRAPFFLYLVVQGAVDLTVEHGGQVWFQEQLGPGRFLGEEGLFAGEYEATARATKHTKLFGMTGGDLRTAMQLNPELLELLLHEKLAGRLRRIPLLRRLSDNEIRWLARAIDERDFAAGAHIPIEAEPGIWIIDWGQVQVTGAVNPQPEQWPRWGLTAGNFFVGQGELRRPDDKAALSEYGTAWTAQSAEARLKTHMFRLATEDASRLASTFRDIAVRLAKPLDISGQLAQVGLFSALSDEQRQDLAQICSWEFVPAGQNITTQGSVGHSYVILLDGAAVVSALDERGRLRPRNRLTRGDAYGETSLFMGKERDATVRAVVAPGGTGSQSGLAGSEHLLLDRRDLQYAIAEDPRRWKRDGPLVRQMVWTKEEVRPFDWLQDGEEVLWQDRSHLLWLLIPELSLVAAILILLLLTLAAPPDWRNPLLVALAIVTGVLGVPFGIWLAYNYMDDYYAITNRRVTRRDHMLLMYEARVEAPLEMVQDVTIDTNFWARLLNYGTVTIRTAAKVGVIVFGHVPGAEVVKNKILQEKAEALTSRRSRNKEELRRGLITELRIALPIPQRGRALGDGVISRNNLSAWQRFRQELAKARRPPPRLPRSKGSKPQWFIALSKKLPPNWQKVLVGTPPTPKPLTGSVTWRKHWLSLVERTLLPFLVTLLLVAAGLLARSVDLGVLGLTYSGLTLPWLLLLGVSVFWLWWNIENYRNDLYILTDDKIIDVEMKPLGLFAKRREGNLERVQSVDFKQVGFAAYIFNYGDVIIRTAAADEGYDFHMVSNPKLVQSIVFQKLDALRSRQETKKTQDRQQELIEGLDVYHELREAKRQRTGE